MTSGITGGNRGQTSRRWCRHYGRITSATGVRVHAQSLYRRGRLSGDFLINAQGEDVVAGIRTPRNITGNMRARLRLRHKASMETASPRRSRS